METENVKGKDANNADENYDNEKPSEIKVDESKRNKSDDKLAINP